MELVPVLKCIMLGRVPFTQLTLGYCGAITVEYDSIELNHTYVWVGKSWNLIGLASFMNTTIPPNVLQYHWKHGVFVKNLNVKELSNMQTTAYSVQLCNNKIDQFFILFFLNIYGIFHQENFKEFCRIKTPNKIIADVLGHNTWNLSCLRKFQDVIPHVICWVWHSHKSTKSCSDKHSTMPKWPDINSLVSCNGMLCSTWHTR